MGASFVVYTTLLVPAAVTRHATFNGFRDVVVYNGVALGAVVVTAVAAPRGKKRGTWRCLSIAIFATVVSDVGFGFLATAVQVPTLWGLSPLDVGYAAFYPFALLFVIGLLRARASRWQPNLVLDGLATAALAAALALTFCFGPLIQELDEDGVGVGAMLTWPILDVALLVVLVCGALTVSAGLDRQLALVAGALIVLGVGDVWYVMLVHAGTYTTSGLVNLAWPVAFCLFAFASTVPAESRAGNVHTFDVRPWVYIVLPMSMAAVGVTLLSPLTGDGVNTSARWLVVGALCLAMVRVGLTYLDLWSLKEIRRQALTDELTGLRNRRALAQEGRALFEAMRRDTTRADDVASPVALLMLDLDGFKEINDSLGHNAGDALLVELADRLAGSLRSPADVLARLGGDEFAVLLPRTNTCEAEALARRLRESVSHPVLIDDAHIDVTGSFGVAVAPQHGSDLSQLMRRADIAMYRAKKDPGGVVVYDPQARDMYGEDRRQRICEMRYGLDHGEFVVYYQPQINLRTHATFGVEALVRWAHPRDGLLAPDLFLPLVEDCGLMPQLTAYVLDVAVHQAARWRADGNELCVAVNLAPSAVVDASLPGRVRSTLAHAGLPPDLLVLEITEETLLQDRQRARAILAEIREVGVRISIDDFGSGYSSLAYLRELPVDEIKLDRSFVQPMTEDGRAASIVRAAIGLAHSLSMTIVAEGVEDAAAARQLTIYGCDVAQGYFYARPQPPDDLQVWFRRAGTPLVVDDVVAGELMGRPVPGRS